MSVIFVGCFGIAALLVSLWAVWRVAASPFMRYKLLWIVGSLIGFVGFSINWTSPGDLYMLFGVQFLPVFATRLPGSGELIVKTAFPVIAIVALAISRKRPQPNSEGEDAQRL